ncbi:NACHT domain-containing protein [Streptomyces sp. NPDC127106]|uniref:NACHT domain-containing protein n=1 Tax=Streptomyces sp. NPDC127106 TaxID=3345360 RepID=UPI00362F4222
MAGFETAALRAASTAAGWLWKSQLGQVPGARLTDRPVRPAARWRRPAELGAPELRRLAEQLADRLGGAASRLPEHERLAALDAVADAFALAGPDRLDADALLAADLDPTQLAAKVPVPPAAGLDPAAEAVCRDLIRLACVHAVEYLTTLPSFGARADVELVRRTGTLQRTVDRLADRADGAAHAFEERYARYVADTHGRLQLFGLTTGRRREEWPLDLAYISLAVSGEQQPALPGEPGVHRTTTKAEQALAAADRVLLRGPAGSGKSTLVQWLALTAARRSGGPWNTCVPFVLRLRAFTTAENLPLPEEFLKASGVPLSAPPGWVEELMLGGRALVLVDGVDEVPQRLRSRTETWLRSLVSAFPRARYVVTTRPSAVPEDWLAGQGFVPHALLPMEREDVAAFIAHWHTAARAEAGPAGEDLDAYEASLREAVTARRDLSRLATNPLMCALLCALNRDRRMQLPRARKELYDAALDMLLVRRDTEREIAGVEGVDLTRDEQIVLLQRFAYWLIRNGQVEAGRDEAVELVEEWLEGMPQVREQAGAEQVFAHLLIRSGLLREPVPGSVDFVHRTFQDYLGAKAAVESRDFGVLVKNAHDDTWDDVVRMAVGHARPDERTRILRGLLKRADKVKGARSRLIVLAAACLEHAPELDPSLRRDIQSRTADLLPPRTISEAEELARAGDLVLDLLPGPEELSEEAAAATIRTAAVVGTPHALAVIARFRHERRARAVVQLARGWSHFDVDEYVDTVLSEAALENVYLWVENTELAAALPRVRHLRYVILNGDLEIPDEVIGRPEVERLTVVRNTRLTDPTPLAAMEGLTHLGFQDCPHLSTIAPLGGLPLRDLTLARVERGLSLAPLAKLGGLTGLHLDYATEVDSVRGIPGDADLTTFALWKGARHVDLVGLERWPALASLTLAGDKQLAQLAGHRRQPPLRTLQVLGQDGFDPAVLPRYEDLRFLGVSASTFTGGLRPLRNLPNLTELVLLDCRGPIDLAPLAALEQLEITVHPGTVVQGAEQIPPERLTFVKY